MTMIGAIWNVRGLNKRGRLQCVTDFIYDNALDFVGFQETKKEEFHDALWNQLNKGFVWQNPLSYWYCWGVLFGINSRKFEALS